MNKGPIKTEAEADEIRKFLVRTTMDVLKLNYDEAKRRVVKLMDSEILFGGHPDDVMTQKRIDWFLNIPSSKHNEVLPLMLQSEAYKECLIESLSHEELVRNYDRLTNSKLHTLLDAGTVMKQPDNQSGRVNEEIEKFNVFFHDTIWTRFQEYRQNPQP